MTVVGRDRKCCQPEYEWCSPSPFWGMLYHLCGMVKSLLALLSGVVVAYTDDGYLKGAHR